MKNPLSRVLLTLAASDVSPIDLHRFFRWIQRLGPDKAIDIIQNIRRNVDEVEYFSVGLPKSTGSRVQSNIIAEKNVARRLEHLLLSEMKLTKGDAVDLILREIRELKGSTANLPTHKKIAFSLWLERIIRHVGRNTLLQIASKIRSEVSRHKNIDWPLRRDKS